jgi:hypothetical protein
MKQKPVAWADEIIYDLNALFDSEMIKEIDSGDALIRLDAAICAVEEAEERHTNPPAAQAKTIPKWPLKHHWVNGRGYVVWRDVFEGNMKCPLDEAIAAHTQSVFVDEADAKEYCTFKNTTPPAQPAQQEPVAWAVFEGWNAHDLYLPQEYDEALKMAGYKGDHAEVKPLYTHPSAAQREPAPGYCKHCKQYTIEEPLAAAQRQPLTEERLLEILGDIDADTKRLPPGVKAFARGVEEAHNIKERNNAA